VSPLGADHIQFTTPPRVACATTVLVQRRCVTPASCHFAIALNRTHLGTCGATGTGQAVGVVTYLDTVYVVPPIATVVTCWVMAALALV
jgi:hypothetical protein